MALEHSDVLLSAHPKSWADGLVYRIHLILAEPPSCLPHRGELRWHVVALTIVPLTQARLGGRKESLSC